MGAAVVVVVVVVKSTSHLAYVYILYATLCSGSGRSWAWTGPDRTACTASCIAAAAAEGRMQPDSWTSTPEYGSDLLLGAEER
eukprot:PDM61662.1 hypothetical protein PRIPAC_51104 [Pristionchus pacificus]